MKQTVNTLKAYLIACDIEQGEYIATSFDFEMTTPKDSVIELADKILNYCHVSGDVPCNFSHVEFEKEYLETTRLYVEDVFNDTYPEFYE